MLTAIKMQQALVGLNKRLAAKGWPELKIGIGVNNGAMTIGDMGSPVRQSYRVMGDAVNPGSRLEGVNKQYGAGIIVGEATRERLKKDFVFRELDRVKGKDKDEPLGLNGGLSRTEGLRLNGGIGSCAAAGCRTGIRRKLYCWISHETIQVTCTGKCAQTEFPATAGNRQERLGMGCGNSRPGEVGK